MWWRNTESLCSGRSGGPPLGGLTTNSTNSRTLALQNVVGWSALFSLSIISSFPALVLSQFSMWSSLLRISKRMATYKLLKTTTSGKFMFKSNLDNKGYIRQTLLSYHGRWVTVSDQSFQNVKPLRSMNTGKYLVMIAKNESTKVGQIKWTNFWKHRPVISKEE